ncbi:MAG: LysR family transcriptional regulator [Sneathiella sp.]
MQGQDWDDLRIALAISREKTFAATARLLSVNESTISRHLARLEERLNAKIFNKTPEGFIPTQAGIDLLKFIEVAELQIEAAENIIKGENLRIAGRIRITAVPIIINQVLVPALKPFTEKYQDLEVELIAETADLSLYRREADIALRLARPQKDMQAISQRIGTLTYGTYQSKDISDEQGGENLPWITYENRMEKLPQAKWIADKVNESSQDNPKVFVNDAETLLQCLKLGVGKSLLPCGIGDKVSNLKRIDEGEKDPLIREIWLLVNSDLRELQRFKVTIDWIKKAIKSSGF